MPELPEVQTGVNYIKPLCVGKNLIRVKPVWSKVLHNFNEGFNSNHFMAEEFNFEFN